MTGVEELVVDRLVSKVFEDIPSCQQHDLQRRDALLTVDDLPTWDFFCITVVGRSDNNRPEEMLAKRLQVAGADLSCVFAMLGKSGDVG